MTATGSSHPPSLPRRLWPWLLTLAPGLMLFLLVLKYEVNIPFLDDWSFVDLDEKASKHQLTVHDFFAGWIEHRPAFLRALMLLMHHFWPGDYTKETLLTFAFLPLTAWMVHLLMKRTTGEGFRAWWPVMALMNLAIFTPVQYQIVLWPMLFQITCLTFFLGAILVSLTGRLPLWARFVIGLFCSLAGLLSFGSGIILFVIPVPVILLADVFASKKSRWLYLAAWLAAFAITSALYFHDLKNEAPSQFANKQEVGDDTMLQRDIMEVFRRPGEAALFVLRMLGTHLARGSGIAMMDQGLLTGALSALLFVFAVVIWIRNYGESRLRDAMLTWLCYGSYSIGSALMVAMGRLKETQTGENALSARYVIHSVPLTVALLALLWIMGRHFSARRPELAPRIARWGSTSAAVYVTAQVVLWAAGVRCMEVWSSSRLRNATDTLFFKNRIPIEGVLAPNKVNAKTANGLGLLKPPMLEDGRLDNFTLSDLFLHPSNALLDNIDFDTANDGTENLEVRGFASIDRHRRNADGVFLTYRDRKDGHWEIFHVLQVQAMPPYLSDTIGRDLQHTFLPGRKLTQDALSGFAAYIPIADLVSSLPEGENEVMAWAFDWRNQKASPMHGLFRIDLKQRRILPIDEKNLDSAGLQGFLDLARQRKTRPQKQ